MEIIHLPHDLFLLIVARLSARTIVLCRQVSRAWNVAFTEQDLNLQLLKDRFPRCRELRLAYFTAAAAASVANDDDDNIAASSGSEVQFPRIPLDGKREITNGIQEQQDWTSTFALVARRYHHLRTATPRSLTKIRLGTTGPDNNNNNIKYRFYGVATWDRYLRLDDKTAPFHYPDPSWCYAQEEGLLVYHVHPDDVEDTPRTYIYPWRLLDLETGEEVEVAFPHDGNERIVRRVRLAAGVLVFEWCERLAYHQLNDREECHRHYVTAFDVVRIRSSSSSRPANDDDSATHRWETIQRAEWKLHFLGLPLNHTDRFFSTHTATHYAVYVWQPNRSPWGEDDPIESVIIWDMTCSSTNKPPRIIRRMTWPALAFYGVRQRGTPRLRCLGMDQRNLFFVEEEHRWAQGGHSSLSPPRVHLVRTTGIPIIPGPVVEVVDPMAATEQTIIKEDGLTTISFAADDDDNDHHQQQEEEEQIVYGPHWLDKCGANGDVNLSFCSRLDKSSSSSSSYSVSATSSDGSPGIWNGAGILPPGTTTPRRNSSPLLTFTHEILAAIHAPATRWPGWAPCWRHEEFPYLTVSEMVDFKAGVRITARHCFMLETLSVHARPSLLVRRGLGTVVSTTTTTAGESSSSSSSRRGSSLASVVQQGINNRNGVEATQSVNTRLNGKLKARKKSKGDGGEGKRSVSNEGEDEMGGDEEVQFADEMWDQLLGRGYICGDERWLIGEDREGSVTIVRF